MFYHEAQHQYINVSVDYMERAVKHSFHAQLMSFWLCLKFNRGDSAYRPTISGIMKDFGCGHTTAKRIYEHVTTVGDNLLFRYNPETNLLVAKTWKLAATPKHCAIAPKKKALMAYCVKVIKPHHLTIKEAVKAMKSALIKVAISEVQRQDKFLTEGTTFSSCSDRRNALNQRKLGRRANCHRSTASRLLKRMELNGEITVTRHRLVAVKDLVHDVWVLDEDTVKSNLIDKRNLIPIGKIAYVRDANEYHLTKFGTEREVRNVIINYATRINYDLRNNTHRRVKATCVVNTVHDGFLALNSQFD